MSSEKLFEETCELHCDKNSFEIFKRFLEIFKDFLEDFRDRSISKENGELKFNGFMYFDNGEGLPEDLTEELDNCDCTIDFTDKPIRGGKSAYHIMRNAIFFDDKIFLEKGCELPLYFWSKNDKLVIFGRKAFEYIFNDLFKGKETEQMLKLSVPILSLPKIPGGGFSEELTDKETFIAAAKNYDRQFGPNNENWKELLSGTDYRYHDNDKTICYYWKGYGAKTESEDTVCPVCGASLPFSAIDKQLGIYEIDKISLPLIMCKNCSEIFNSEAVYVRKKTKKSLKRYDICDYIAGNSEIILELHVQYGDRKTTEYKKVFLTTPHRLMIYKMYEKKEQSDFMNN